MYNKTYIFIALLVILIPFVSRLIRNILDLKEGKKAEDNYIGRIAEMFYKKRK